MGVIIPAILASSRREIEDALARITGLVDTVQIDVVDGVLAGTPSWPYSEGGLAKIPPVFDIHDMGNVRFEMDLMVREPRDAMRAFLRAGAGRIILHAESTADLGPLLDELERTYGRDKEFSSDLLSVAIALHADTDMKRVEPHLSRVDYVQFMGIAREGNQGQPFDERILAAIGRFRSTHPDVPVQVDGGVSRTTAPALFSAGAHRLVVGSALWKSEDIAATLREFEELAQEYNRYR